MLPGRAAARPLPREGVKIHVDGLYLAQNANRAAAISRAFLANQGHFALCPRSSGNASKIRRQTAIWRFPGCGCTWGIGVAQVGQTGVAELNVAICEISQRGFRPASSQRREHELFTRWRACRARHDQRAGGRACRQRWQCGSGGSKGKRQRRDDGTGRTPRRYDARIL